MNRAEYIKNAADYALRGSRHGMARLDVPTVREIKENPARLKQSDLAEIHGIDRITVSKIQNGRRWRHI